MDVGEDLMMTRDRYPFSFSMIGLLLLFAPVQQAAAASSFAFVSLNEPFISGTTAYDSQSNTSTPATATLGGVTGNAFSDLGTGSVGANLLLASGAGPGFYDAGASWFDTWNGVGTGTVPVSAAISIRGTVGDGILTTAPGSWEIQFRYMIGSDIVLSFLAFRDSSNAFDPPEFSADANGVNITSSIVFTQNAANPLLTDFSLTASPTVPVSGSGFTDFMELLVRSDAGGPLTVDTFHTFQVSLTSLDPGSTFTGEGGRTVSSVPEPGTIVLVLGGLGLLAGRRRRTSP
jgi:hypothetical protein